MPSGKATATGWPRIGAWCTLALPFCLRSSRSGARDRRVPSDPELGQAGSARRLGASGAAPRSRRSPADIGAWDVSNKTLWDADSGAGKWPSPSGFRQVLVAKSCWCAAKRCFARRH